ncbi:unnamed protein product [Orchesella dallaii]|uniref:Uncharacterized protein n=1 Tax=Orchesella dallaii TaxID=48710 RepID=A0ABP1Q8C6_9HEXA
MNSSPPIYRLVYGGSDSFSNDEGRLIITQLCVLLISALKSYDSNLKVLAIFKASGLLDELEFEELLKNLDSQTFSAWTINFFKFLGNRCDVCKALNLLLNLNNDPHLSNYRSIIKNAFVNISNSLPKTLTIESINPESSPRLSTQRTIPRNYSSVSIPESDVTQSLLGSSTTTTPPEEEYHSQNSYWEKYPKMTTCIAFSALLAIILGLGINISAAINNGINTPGHSGQKEVAAVDEMNEVTMNYSTAGPLWQSNKTPESTSEMPGSSFSSKIGSTTLPLFSLKAAAENRKVEEDQNQSPSPVTEMATEMKDSTTISSSTPMESQEQTPTPGHSKVTPRDKLHRQFYIKSPFDIKHNTTQICDPNYRTTIAINIEHHYDWHGVVIDCGARVYSLKMVEGYPSIQNIDEILTQTPNIRNLHIQCNRVSMGFAEKTTKHELKKLRSLKLSSDNVASDCFDILSYLATHVNFPTLTKLDIDKITITGKTKPEILRIMSKMKSSSSSSVEINLSDIILKTFINISSKMRNFNYGRFSLNLYNVSSSEDELEIALKTVENFLSNANDLKDFETNVALPDKKMPHILKQFKRLKIRKLFAVVQVKEGRSHLSFNFTKFLKKLEKLELKLVGWEKGNASQPFMLLTDFTSLSQSLKEFRVSTDFVTKALGADNVHCRTYHFAKNSEGGISIEMNVCSDCNDQVGCMRRRKRSEIENKSDSGTDLS